MSLHIDELNLTCTSILQEALVSFRVPERWGKRALLRQTWAAQKDGRTDRWTERWTDIRTVDAGFYWKTHHNRTQLIYAAGTLWFWQSNCQNFSTWNQYKNKHNTSPVFACFSDQMNWIYKEIKSTDKTWIILSIWIINLVLDITQYFL